jgi:hypothetical protein
VVVRWWCCRSSLPSVSLEIFSGAVVEERALEHGPPETNPRFPPGHHQIPMGCLLRCTLHVILLYHCCCDLRALLDAIHPSCGI